MLFHEMMNSDDTRKAREVIEEQEREGIIENTIYGKVTRILREMGINMQEVYLSRSLSLFGRRNAKLRPYKE